MYVTSANECYALDAGSGREIWHYQRPRTKGLIGNAAGGVNRGVGVAGDRVFMVTDHAHLIALNRSHRRAAVGHGDGGLAPELQRDRRAAAVGNLVISGISGGDEGVRGFRGGVRSGHRQGGLALLDGAAPGEPGSETWQGKGIDHPGGDDLDDRHLRSGARHALLAGRQSRSGLIGDDRARRQSLHRFDRRARRRRPAR